MNSDPAVVQVRWTQIDLVSWFYSHSTIRSKLPFNNLAYITNHPMKVGKSQGLLSRDRDAHYCPLTHMPYKPKKPNKDTVSLSSFSLGRTDFTVTVSGQTLWWSYSPSIPNSLCIEGSMNRSAAPNIAIGLYSSVYAICPQIRHPS